MAAFGNPIPLDDIGEEALAHIEVERTNTSVRTFVRGRVYKTGFHPKSPARVKAKSSTKRRMICLLSARAGTALENWGISHPCETHPHFTRSQIERMVAAGDLRWVGNGENVAAYRAPRFLAVRQSGPVTCVQLVES